MRSRRRRGRRDRRRQRRDAPCGSRRRGFARQFSENCGLITLDAHFDLRDLSNGLTNGNPVRALLADGLPGENIVQIGIQPFANSQAYAQVANDAGITVVTMSQIRAHGVERLLTESLDDLSERVEHIYVNLDINSLDRVFAPATPGSRPGGLTPYELRRVAWLCGAHPLVRAIDLVEVDPTQDVADATVMATASCLLSFASGLLARNVDEQITCHHRGFTARHSGRAGSPARRRRNARVGDHQRRRDAPS